VIDELIAAAKGWRPLARFDVIVEGAAGVETVRVKLGESRRRWKRIAAQLAGLTLLGARGYDAKDELIGSWDDVATEDDDQGEDGEAEADDAAAHRLHTQWCIREVSKIHDNTARLCVEMVTASVSLIRAMAANVTTPKVQPVSEDESTRVLGQLLAVAMANQQGKDVIDADAEEIGATGSQGGNPGRQGESNQSGEARTG
jgi:hypothetical protein